MTKREWLDSKTNITIYSAQVDSFELQHPNSEQMPVITKDNYKKPFFLINGHWETVFPSVVFKGPQVSWEKTRLELADGDFLDLNMLRKNAKRCLIITHGLEGSSDRFYVRRTAQFFFEKGWDVIAWNCRSCSGELNRLPQFYHHGATEDLGAVAQHALTLGYEQLALFGYSMGGSMTLKYLGEDDLPKEIIGAATFSVPCNLRDSAVALAKKENAMYEERFLNKLVVKMKEKAKQHPEIINVENIDTMADFDEFHERYTAPLHGFIDAAHFFEEATCDKYMPNIRVPVLVANAQNDPMLDGGCYPYEIAKASEHVYLQVTKHGGHCGFTRLGKDYSWMESQANDFFEEML